MMICCEGELREAELRPESLTVQHEVAVSSAQRLRPLHLKFMFLQSRRPRSSAQRLDKEVPTIIDDAALSGSVFCEGER